MGVGVTGKTDRSHRGFICRSVVILTSQHFISIRPTVYVTLKATEIKWNHTEICRSVYFISVTFNTFYAHNLNLMSAFSRHRWYDAGPALSLFLCRWILKHTGYNLTLRRKVICKVRPISLLAVSLGPALQLCGFSMQSSPRLGGSVTPYIFWRIANKLPQLWRLIDW